MKLKQGPTLLPIIFLLSFAGHASEEVGLANTYKKLKIESGLTLVDGHKNDIESVSVSGDSSKICWIGKDSTRKTQYPIEIYSKDTGISPEELPSKLKKTKLNAYTKCAFDNENNILTSELRYRPLAITATLISSLLTGDFEPKKYHSVLRTYDSRTNTRLESLSPVELGQLSKKEFIKHPRVSPDGSMITYYTMGNYGVKGIYIYNISTKRVIHLGDFLDKHPTWSADGTKILFHHQVSDRKKGGLEQAYLGYYDLEFSGVDDVFAKRIMLDDINKEGYTYHKHPAVYPGTDLLFFHGQLSPEGNKHIFVRNLERKSKIYKLTLKNANISLKKAKHPATSRIDAGMYFVGKENIQNAKYKVYKLNIDSIKTINKKVE